MPIKAFIGIQNSYTEFHFCPPPPNPAGVGVVSKSFLDYFKYVLLEFIL